MPSSAPNSCQTPFQAFYKRAMALREAPQAARLAFCAATLCLALALAGCGFSIPIKPLGGDELVTGSITPAPKAAEPRSPLGVSLTEEDWRRASNAMAVALDPLGNGERTTWDNADTGHGGAFRAAGLPYARAGEVCRGWEAEVTIKGTSVTRRGTACRAPGDDWRIADSTSAS